MWRWLGPLLALALGGCAASIPADVLRKAHLAVESLNSVYLLDGTGDRATPVLERRQIRAGPSHLDWLYDSYYAPSLSPDGTRVACLRFRNDSPYGSSPELESIQSVEVLLVRVADRAEQVVMSVPATGRDLLLAPVWAPDGTRIYFAAGRRVWSYESGAARAERVVDIPRDLDGWFRLRQYLRPSRDGDKLFVLLERTNRFWRHYDVIVAVDLAGRTLTPLWTGKLSRHDVFEVDRPLPSEIDGDIVDALFGSREHPVYAPQASGDGRFYFFDRFEMGLLGREWIAGYDRVTRREFEVRTMWRALFWK